MAHIYNPDPSGENITESCTSTIVFLPGECANKTRKVGACTPVAVPDYSGRLDNCLACGGV